MEFFRKSRFDCQYMTHQSPKKDLLKELSNFQRLLLVTDGTVTELLEQYLQEPIQVHKLYEKIEDDFNQLPVSHAEYLSSDQVPILKREVLLQGTSSYKNWIYAESSIVLNHLSQNFRTDLLASLQPIGKLWAKYRTETYKILLCAEKKPAKHLAVHFGIQVQDQVISRTYGVYSNQKLTMLITEVFPKKFFADQ